MIKHKKRGRKKHTQNLSKTRYNDDDKAKRHDSEQSKEFEGGKSGRATQSLSATYVPSNCVLVLILN